MKPGLTETNFLTQFKHFNLQAWNNNTFPT